MPILEGYGLSETSLIATFNRVDRPRHPGSIGLPVWVSRSRSSCHDGLEAKDGEAAEIVICGLPHPSHGEEVKTFVVRTPGGALTVADLVAWCRQNMADYKHSRLVEFRDSPSGSATQISPGVNHRG